MKRTSYKGYIIDTDNLGRIYIYNTASPYSEDSDHIIISCGALLSEVKRLIDQKIAEGKG